MKHAEKLNDRYPYLQKRCLCHVAERLNFKYFLMGIHLLLLFITTGNTLIASNILETLELGRIALVAIYLPYTARCFISHCTAILERQVSNYWIDGLNITRLRHQLQKSKLGLYRELLSLQPFETSECIDTLEFLKHDILDHASFNPVLPIISIITQAGILFIYCYGKGKRSRDIIYHKRLKETRMAVEMSWSPNGKYLYIISTHDSRKLIPIAKKPKIDIYEISKRKYTCRLITSYPLANRLISKYLWLDNNSILYAAPDDVNTHLSKMVIDDTTAIKQPLSNIPTDPNPFTFDILNLFNYVSRPVVVCGLPNLIFFTVQCPCCNKSNNENYILQLSLTNKSLVTLYHLPGRVINMATNGALFIFTYNANSRHETDVHTHVFDMSSNWTHVKCNQGDRANGIIVVGILHKNLTMEYRILERE
jgi:hypothetical protein